MVIFYTYQQTEYFFLNITDDNFMQNCGNQKKYTKCTKIKKHGKNLFFLLAVKIT